MASSMMAERIESTEGTIDINGRQVLGRSFWTLYEDVPALLLDSDCPKLGTPHPQYPRAFLDKYEFATLEDGRLDLRCMYTTDGSGTWQIFDMFKVRYGFGKTTNTVKIPIFYLQTKVLNNIAGTRIFSWEPADNAYTQLTETYPILTAKIAVPKLSIADIANMVGQARRIHLIDGIKYLFLDSDVQPIDNRFDEVYYTWFYDPGTPQPFAVDSFPNLAYPPSIAGTSPELIRKPYHYLLAIPKYGQSPDVPKPEIVNMPYGKRDDSTLYNSWRQLPGLGAP